MNNRAITKKLTAGKVWLVGAGPGDPGLLTLKGKQVLAHAEIVIYDALIGEGILQMIPADAERIYVGKRSGLHMMEQTEINQLLIEKALEGKRVVRLKGGDPFLFGRGGEELEALVKAGISFEVVPGISSAIAVPAYQGIPVTHRNFASSVHILTGHPRKDATDPVDYEALVRVGGTLIFLMGASLLGEICTGLLEAGMDADTPAAVLAQGTMAQQKRILATIATLQDTVEKDGILTPAVIVVGNVCTLAEQFSWADTLPLGGIRVFLTRPKELTEKPSEQLRSLGAEVIECPAIRTIRRENNTALQKALEQIKEYQWLAFTSPTGVHIFFEELSAIRFDVRKLCGIKIACLGSGSAIALAQHGMYPDLVPRVFDTAHLGTALFSASSPGDRILIPRAADGNPDLVNVLADRIVDEVPTYDTAYETNLFSDWQEKVIFSKNDYVFFTSASTVHGFVAALIENDKRSSGFEKNAIGGLTVADGMAKSCGRDFSDLKAICIGAQTEMAAKSYGMQTWTASQATIESMIECLMDAVSK